MSSVAKVPVFKPFTLALIQLGHIGPDKVANLKHAHEMVLKAAAPTRRRPDLIVLPVCNLGTLFQLSASIYLPGMFQFTIWPCQFSYLCRKHCIYSRTTIWCFKEPERKCQDAGFHCQGDWYLAYRRCVITSTLKTPYSALICFLLVLVGSIPERDMVDNNVYNTCTVYNPKGFASLVMVSAVYI